MLRFFYSFLLVLLRPCYYALALFHKKTKEFRKSRKEGMAALLRFLESCETKPDAPLYWLHGSSVGEIDQALALARVLRSHRPEARILLSAFSLSVRLRPIEGIDLFFYMPLDFMPGWKQIWKGRPMPEVFVSMTWDVFPNLLHFLNKQGVSCYLCSASLAESNRRLKWPWRRLLAPVYGCLAGIGAVDETNRRRFERLHPRPEAVRTTGDSRFDTIFYKINNVSLNPRYSRWLSSRKEAHSELLILASTYRAEEEGLIPFLPKLLREHPELGVLIFPHKVSKDHIQEIKDLLGSSGVSFSVYSSLESQKDPASAPCASVYLMDVMGLLALSYEKSSLCYVGGGFGKRVHNVAEPAALGNAVLTGPNIDWSGIALELESEGTLLRCRDLSELQQNLRELLANPAYYKQLGKKARSILQGKLGASEAFYQEFLA